MKPNITVDCIFDIKNNYTILIKRGNEPFKDYWALPGGRQKPGEELEEAVLREIREETGLEVIVESKTIPTIITVLGEKTYLEQVKTYASGNDPRRGTATVYAIQLKLDPDKIAKTLRNGDDAKDIQVCKLDQLPELAFEHNKALEEYYTKLKKYKNPIPATDIIIEYQNGIVLIERKNPPHGLAIPGGFAEVGLSLEENAVKEAKEETNLEIAIENPGKPFVFSNPGRDPRQHMISNTFIAKGYGNLKAGDDAKAAKVYSINEITKLIENNGLVFDHSKILKTYLQYKGYLK